MNLICSLCAKEYSADSHIWICSCGGTLNVEFNPRFLLDKIKTRPPNMWRYREAIPVSSAITYGEGFTPLIKDTRYDKEVYLKLDYLFPSGSFKDRGASVMISKIHELGVKQVVEDSSGNAGAAVAAYCAKAGIDCTIYVPESTSQEKLTQIYAYGARVKRIKGSREDTSRAIKKVVSAIYYASHIYNPFFLEGTKTFAFEVVEQMGWMAPECVVVPVGHGSMLLGSYLGFKELMDAGVIEKMPRIIGVQSESCDPLVKAWERGSQNYIPIVKRPSIAEGIAIEEPVRASQILNAIRDTGGKLLSVSENAIMSKLKEAFKRGYYIEPTSATVLAVIEDLPDMGTMVLPLTGTGFKATGKIKNLFDII